MHTKEEQRNTEGLFWRIHWSDILDDGVETEGEWKHKEDEQKESEEIIWMSSETEVSGKIVNLNGSWLECRSTNRKHWGIILERPNRRWLIHWIGLELRTRKGRSRSSRHSRITTRWINWDVNMDIDFSHLGYPQIWFNDAWRVESGECESDAEEESETELSLVEVCENMEVEYEEK